MYTGNACTQKTDSKDGQWTSAEVRSVIRDIFDKTGILCSDAKCSSAQICFEQDQPPSEADVIVAEAKMEDLQGKMLIQTLRDRDEL